MKIDGIEKIPPKSYDNMTRRSVTMIYTVRCTWDEEANVWIATSDDVPGLVLESGSLDALMEKVSVAVPELIELNGLPNGASLHYVSEKTQRMYA